MVKMAGILYRALQGGFEHRETNRNSAVDCLFGGVIERMQGQNLRLRNPHGIVYVHLLW